MKCWAEGFPKSTLRRYCLDAAQGNLLTKSGRKQEMGVPVGQSRRGASTVRSHAQGYVEAEVLRLSELQPNTRPFMNVAGDVVLTRHMDPILPVCKTCTRAVVVRRSPATPVDECMPCADSGPSDTANRLCDHICQYAGYVEQSRELGENHAQPSLFRSIYVNVLKALGVSMRRNKGVSSECSSCRVYGNIIALPTDERTEAQYEHAKHGLARHYGVVDRFRGDEQAIQMRSKRDIRIRDRDGVFHSMKDKVGWHMRMIHHRMIHARVAVTTRARCATGGKQQHWGAVHTGIACEREGCKRRPSSIAFHDARDVWVGCVHSARAPVVKNQGQLQLYVQLGGTSVAIKEARLCTSAPERAR